MMPFSEIEYYVHYMMNLHNNQTFVLFMSKWFELVLLLTLGRNDSR